MFASLVPGIGISINWPPPCLETSSAITYLEITPVLPAHVGERQPDDISTFFMECLLDYMVSQAPKIQWNDGSPMWPKSIDFLYERFKEFYIPVLFADFKVTTDIYKPHAGTYYYC